MKKLLVLAVLATVALTGCKPTNGSSPNGGRDNGGREPKRVEAEFDPTITPDYTALVSTYHIQSPRERNPGQEVPVRRSVTCTIVGIGKGGQPVTVTDARKGTTFLYSMTVDARTPVKIPMKSYANLYSIEILCTALRLRAGDRIYCEFTIGDENGPPAPVLNVRNFDDAEALEGKPILVATCGARINVLA